MTKNTESQPSRLLFGKKINILIASMITLVGVGLAIDRGNTITVNSAEMPTYRGDVSLFCSDALAGREDERIFKDIQPNDLFQLQSFKDGSNILEPNTDIFGNDLGVKAVYKGQDDFDFIYKPYVGFSQHVGITKWPSDLFGVRMFNYPNAVFFLGLDRNNDGTIDLKIDGSCFP